MCNIAKLLTILHITWHLSATRSAARLNKSSGRAIGSQNTAAIFWYHHPALTPRTPLFPDGLRMRALEETSRLCASRQERGAGGEELKLLKLVGIKSKIVKLSILNLSPPSEMRRLMIIISIGRALTENLMTRSRSNSKVRVN
jgi:hypothetical protein